MCRGFLWSCRPAQLIQNATQQMTQLMVNKTYYILIFTPAVVFLKTGIAWISENVGTVILESNSSHVDQYTATSKVYT